MNREQIKTVILWGLTGLTGLAFIAAGGMKLMGVEQVLVSFQRMGLPDFTGTAIGLLEVLGGIGLFIPALSRFAAAGLAAIMIGAIYYHLVYDPATTAPAVILFIFCDIIIALRTFDKSGAR